MLSMLLTGEIRPHRAWKLAVAMIPVIFVLIALAFIAHARWKEKRTGRKNGE
ncbi:hypothetical protein ACVPDB_004494 [Escherichia coli]|jgi:ABC-type spermidine/putrescine transport system permease subunit I